jgi:solute carrier family 35 protein F1/2
MEGDGHRPNALAISMLKGQAISVMTAGTGFFASLLSSNNVSVPMLLALLNYALLSPYLFMRAKLPPFPLSLPFPLLASTPPTALYEDSLMPGGGGSSGGDREEGRGSSSLGNGNGNGIISSSSSSNSNTYNKMPDQDPDSIIDIGSGTGGGTGGGDGSYLAVFCTLSCPWWLYALIATVDLEANVLVVSAYRYTSVTSVMLLDCFSIPCVMLLSHFFLGAQYTRRHLGGVVVCLCGMACIVYSDYSSSNGCEECSDPIYGDILCLVGTSLYAVSNVMQEKLVKHRDREEYLGMLGLFGSLLAAGQLLVLPEGRHLSSVRWGHGTAGFVVGFVLCLNLMYTGASLFLMEGDAALLNLSLLTSDVYAVVFSFFYYGYVVSWLYCLAFGLACLGVAIYSTADPPTAPAAGARGRGGGGGRAVSKDINSNASIHCNANIHSNTDSNSNHGIASINSNSNSSSSTSAGPAPGAHAGGQGLFQAYHSLPPAEPLPY